MNADEIYGIHPASRDPESARGGVNDFGEPTCFSLPGSGARYSRAPSLTAFIRADPRFPPRFGPAHRGRSGARLPTGSAGGDIDGAASEGAPARRSLTPGAARRVGEGAPDVHASPRLAVSNAQPVLRRLRGVLAPVVTTFRRDEAIDLDAFSDNLRAHLAAGLDGIVVAGSTGEAALLDDEERARLVAMARAVVPDERLLLAGVGAESTRQTVRRCRQAAEQGADAVLCVAPHYYTAAMTADALRVHYRRVADESPVPVVLYNIPKYMHFALDAGLVAELAQHDNVVGIKDSSGDPAILGGFLQAQSETFTVLTGFGGGVHAALKAGARGGILAVSLFAPAMTREVVDRFAAGDDAGSADAQGRLMAVAREIVGGLGVPGVKAAMDAVGLRGGAVRRPLAPLPEAVAARVASLLAEAGLRDAGEPAAAGAAAS